jgi:phosphoglycolate phosphatase-like HAD superfamily hydrolase
LAALQARGWTLALASGTDWNSVQDEARLLGIDRFFGARIYAPREGQAFAKGTVVADLLAELHLGGSALLGIGDGPVETLEVKRAGGTALGVAHNHDRPRQASGWRREQLVRAGADAIVTDYQEADALVKWLCDEEA